MKRLVRLCLPWLVLVPSAAGFLVKSGDPMEGWPDAPYAFQLSIQPGPEDRRECRVDLEISDLRTGQLAEHPILRCGWGSECQFAWCSRDQVICYVTTIEVDATGDTASWKALVLHNKRPVVSQGASVELRK